MPTGELTCEKDKAPTRLTCAQCATPICPQCMTRTPVGMKCLVCAGMGADRRPGARPAWVIPVVIGVILLAVLALPRLFKSDEGTVDDVGFAPNAEGPARYGALGEEARDADLAFTVSAFECGATQVGEGAALRTAQGRFCFLSLTLRNTGRSPVPFFGPGQALIDGQERRFGIDARATAAHPSNAGRDPTSAVINPANELSSVLVFDIPPDVHPVYVNLLATPRGGSGAFVLLRERT